MRWVARAALAIFALLASQPVSAQPYPSRPIRVLLPFAAGSVSDVSLRIFADKLGARLKISIVVDNQPRAGGTTAVASMRTAAADGYTLVTFSSSTAISVSLLKSLPYDPAKDFQPISGLSTFANLIAANGKSKYQTLTEFMTAARANPGKLNVGTTTVGSTNHLAANLWRSMSGLDVVIVPFRTPGDLVTAVIRGDVDVVIQSFGALKSYVEGGQLRALASTNPQRAAYARDIPTMDEAGVKGFDVVTWNGFYAPANTPADVAAQLNREIRATLGDAELIRRFHDLGLETLPSTPEALQARMQDEIAKWGKVIAEAGIPKQ
jgi:tripartite-type tricarboxylate transporter receptor subunit TctC